MPMGSATGVTEICGRTGAEANAAAYPDECGRGLSVTLLGVRAVVWLMLPLSVWKCWRRGSFRTGKRRVKLPPTAGRFDKRRIFVNGIEALELRADVIAFQFGVLSLEDVRRRGRFKEGFELPADIVVYVRLRGKGGTQEKPESKKQCPQHGAGEAGRCVFDGL
ncbi:MAG: hypothetical protein ACLSHC_06210 [Bilophila wadsworthia]